MVCLLIQWGMFWLFLFTMGCQKTDSLKSKVGCPDGLLPIPPTSPMFCIQPFEARINSSGEAISEQGQLPDINRSLTDAFAACTQTIREGVRLRLATHQEWLDAGDGQIGEGGKAFPWGEKDDARCILDSPKNPNRWKTVQPTGSMHECVSDWGVYDQIGNAWEWVDLEQTASKEAWVRLLESNKHVVQVSESKIELSEQLLPRMRLQTICVDMSRLIIQEGSLQVDLNKPISPDCESGGRGYLWANFVSRKHQDDALPEVGSLLPVRIVGTSVVWDKSRDEEAVGAKVGGSFYSGAQMTLKDLWIGHIPSFDGSIGFRCTSDPI
jgi:hypothetical protein